MRILFSAFALAIAMATPTLADDLTPQTELVPENWTGG